MLSGGNSNVPSPLLVIRWRQRTASRKATEGVKESIVSCASLAPPHLRTPLYMHVYRAAGPERLRVHHHPPPRGARLLLLGRQPGPICGRAPLE